MAYTVILCKDGESADITNLVSELSWEENMDTVGVSLSFSVPDVDDWYIPRLLITAGDIVILNNDDGELIRAVVLEVSRSYPTRSIKASDFGFYLNKNDIVVQFKDKSVSDCLTELFGKVGVGVGSICDMPAKVDKVYIDNVKNIIDDLIEIQSGNDSKDYYYEVRGSEIYVFQLTEDAIDYIFKPAVNVAAFDVTDKNVHGRGEYTHSIENMKNRVTAVINSKTTGNLPAMEYTVSDDANINKYGLLAENYTVNSDDYENIKELANNELTDKNKLSHELNMEFIGHDDARPGRVMHIVDDYLGIDDYFRIQSVSHEVNGDTHTMSCTLEYLKENTETNYTESEVVTREDVTKSSTSSESTSSDANSFISSLTAQIGKPYVWGGSGPDVFDCSGLVYYCLNQSGTTVARTTAQGYYNMCTIVSAADRQPGDLIFWADGTGVYHIAVYVGDGYMIGAQNESIGVVKIKVSGGVYAYGRL